MSSPMPAQRLKVLVVDDHIDLRRLMRLTLEIEGHEVFEAGTGVEALEVAAREVPDVVALDIMMPGELQGLEVCRRLRADPSLAGIHVILVSARQQQTDIEAGKAAGADYYLGKPFSPRKLAELVEASGPRSHPDVAVRRATEQAIAAWSGVYDLRELRQRMKDGG